MTNMEEKELGVHRDWMSRLPEDLLDVPMWNLAIPGKWPKGSWRKNDTFVVFYCPLLSSGSHDSMSFCLDVSSPVLRSESRLLRVMDRLFPCWTRPCVYRWATTQVKPALLLLLWCVQVMLGKLFFLDGWRLWTTVCILDFKVHNFILILIFVHCF